MSVEFTWRQKLIIRAASAVDYLEIDAPAKSNIPYGVYASLVDRGYLRYHKHGWEITEEGRALDLWWSNHDREERMKWEWMMSHLPRFFIRASADGKWLVLDRMREKERRNDPVNIKRTRREARENAQRLNVAERESRGNVDGHVPMDGELTHDR